MSAGLCCVPSPKDPAEDQIWGKHPSLALQPWWELSNIDSSNAENWEWWANSEAPASHWYLLGTKKSPNGHLVTLPKQQTCSDERLEEQMPEKRITLEGQWLSPQHASGFSITESLGVSAEPSFLLLKGIATNLGTERTISSWAARKARWIPCIVLFRHEGHIGSPYFVVSSNLWDKPWP